MGVTIRSKMATKSSIPKTNLFSLMFIMFSIGTVSCVPTDFQINNEYIQDQNQNIKNTEAVPTFLIDKTKCDACQSMFVKLDNILLDNHLQTKVIDILEEDICMRLPDGPQKNCNDTLSTKVPMIFNDLVSHVFDPTTDCEDLGFCDKETMTNTEENNLKCDICDEAASFVANHVLENKKTTDFMYSELEKVCALLPSEYGSLCNDALNQTIPQVLVYVGNFIENQGCVEIGFCDKNLLRIESKDVIWDSFREFIKKFERKYDDVSDYMMRFIVYCDNYEFVKQNTKPTLKFELNEYADLSPIEFAEEKHDACYLFNKQYEETKQVCKEFKSTKNVNELPSMIDWRDHGAVTPVKNQEQCGSCWSFSATGSMEGAYAIKTGNLTSFSEQELVDCSKSYGNMGCEGGLMDSAFEYAIQNGICTEQEEPYEAKDETCMDNCETKYHFSDCIDVTPNNEEHLMEAVSFTPVSVAIEADHQVFMFYKSGIIDSVDCGTNLDHGVLVVGYGEENGQKYWIVKNSWGIEWGEDGYVRIARDDSKIGSQGICGIASQPSYIEY